MTERFLQDRVELLCGDCREQIAMLEDNSIDACVTDPPYSLVSIVKRFGNEGSAPAQFGTDGAYARASAGFMGKAWDTGEVAFDPAFWAEVLRVLKPGGHLLAMGGTRTYHRLACAIEDAGFEIRDCVMWVYGSGFPKSHDVSKGIDKRGGTNVNWFGPWLRAWRAEKGIAQKDVAALFPSRTGGKTGCVANWELGLGLPTVEQFNLICSTFNLPFASMEEAEREVVGRGASGKTSLMGGLAGVSGEYGHDITAPATDSARQWQGWGTALKPAVELIVLARKPLSEKTVAANVLAHGTGALNIDACRVATDGEERKPVTGFANKNLLKRNAQANDRPWMLEVDPEASGAVQPHVLGRWPANIIHDGSEEVVGAFPETGISAGGNSTSTGNPTVKFLGADESKRGAPCGFGDSGSAARFFYTAKADGDDRLGSKHPTVKPLDLMQYLCRLITPKGGTVLDPFAGTGTTGEAAFREGFRAVLIEREEEYQADIRRRMALVLSGADERSRESMKEKQKGKPIDYGPLFGRTDDFDIPEAAE